MANAFDMKKLKAWVKERRDRRIAVERHGPTAIGIQPSDKAIFVDDDYNADWLHKKPAKEEKPKPKRPGPKSKAR